jgi:hypothetical protein
MPTTVRVTPRTRIPSSKNITELRLQLAEWLAELGNGEIKRDDAKELANMAGKIIKSVGTQIEYAALRKEKPEIPFAK